MVAIASLAHPEVHAADPQPYDVKIQPTGDASIDAALKSSSSLVSLQKTAPAGPFALVTRAQDDVGRLQTALHSFGYYASTATIRIDGHALDDPSLPDELTAKPAGQTAAITVSVERGPMFHLRHVTVKGDVAPADIAKLGIKDGDPVVATQVLAAQNNLLAALRDTGHPLAKVSDPDAVEYPADHAIDVTFTADPGPRVDIGQITVEGLKVTNASFIRRRLLVRSGEQYNPAAIDRARQDLQSIGIFGSVDATTPDHLAPDGTIPLRFTVTERDRHTVAVNVGYSTDTGPIAGATFTYRNVFGNAETLTLGAAITQAEVGAAIQRPGYNFNATFTQPDFLRRDQTLTTNLGYVKENLYAYSRRAELASTTLSRKLTDQITASVGLAGVQEQVYQEGTNTTYELAQVPLGLSYDSTGPNGLFEPTQGIKAKFTVTPTEPFGGNSAFFTLLQANASTYFNLSANPGHSVIAVRGLVGVAVGATNFQIPPDQRFYAGGSATVRGYAYQSVGPQFADFRPTGGSAVDTFTVEYRQRVVGNIGAVAFVDAGQVSQGSSPFQGRLFEGVGVGARYFTSFGPIRLDVAVPLEKRRKDQILQAYIGLGEAF